MYNQSTTARRRSSSERANVTPITPELALQAVLPGYRAHLRALNHRPRGIASYLWHIDDFVRFLGNGVVADITPQRIDAYQRLVSGRWSAKTVSLALTVIRSFCRYLVDAELRLDDPSARIRFPRLGKTLPHPLHPTQLHTLIAALDEPPGLEPVASFWWRRNRLMIHLMLYAGLRISEVAALQWIDTRIDDQVLEIRGAKGDKDRAVPIHATLLQLLRQADAERTGNEYQHVISTSRGTPMTHKSLAHVFERWVPGKLGLPFAFTAHQLRHSFCTQLIKAGARLFDVQDLMGHEDPKTTRRYYAVTGEHLRSAVDQLPETW